VKAPTHAKFNQDEAVNHWGISSRTLRQLMEHFGPKIELLDINPDGDNVMNFACFTEKQYVKAEGKKHLILDLRVAPVLNSSPRFPEQASPHDHRCGYGRVR